MWGSRTARAAAPRCRPAPAPARTRRSSCATETRRATRARACARPGVALPDRVRTRKNRRLDVMRIPRSFGGTRCLVILMFFDGDHLRIAIAAGYPQCSSAKCNNCMYSKYAMIIRFPSWFSLQLASHSFQLNTTWERSLHPGVDQLMVRSIIQRKQEGGQHDREIDPSHGTDRH